MKMIIFSLLLATVLPAVHATTPEENLAALGLALPTVPPAVAN